MFNQNHVPKLAEENQRFSGTGGVSEGNRHTHFMPAFKDENTGQIEISRFQNGQIAPCHILDGLPDNWILQRDPEGRVVKIKNTVISGFVQLGRFFTRQEAADFVTQSLTEHA